MRVVDLQPEASPPVYWLWDGLLSVPASTPTDRKYPSHMTNILIMENNYRNRIRGGPHWLDSFGADLRWKPPAIMPPVFLGNLPLADSSMLHEASCRLEKNEDVPRYTA